MTTIKTNIRIFLSIELSNHIFNHFLIKIKKLTALSRHADSGGRRTNGTAACGQKSENADNRENQITTSLVYRL
jgi:hypothetical protein